MHFCSCWFGLLEDDVDGFREMRISRLRSRKKMFIVNYCLVVWLCFRVKFELKFIVPLNLKSGGDPSVDGSKSCYCFKVDVQIR